MKPRLFLATSAGVALLATTLFIWNRSLAKKHAPSGGTTSSEVSVRRAEIETSLTDNQMLITGGWASAPGKRTLIMLRADNQSSSERPQAITIRSWIYSVDDRTLEENGLASLRTDSIQPVYRHLQVRSNSEATKLSEGLAKKASLVNRPVLFTISGQPATISLSGHGKDGGNLEMGVVPTIAADGKAVNLRFDFGINP